MRLGPYEGLSLIGAGAWARCTRDATPTSRAPLASRFSSRSSSRTHRSTSGSSAKLARWRRCHTRISARFAPSATRTGRFLGTEYLDGETLAARLARATLLAKGFRSPLADGAALDAGAEAVATRRAAINASAVFPSKTASAGDALVQHGSECEVRASISPPSVCSQAMALHRAHHAAGVGQRL